MQERKRRWLCLVIGNTYERLSLCLFLSLVPVSLSNAFLQSPLHPSLSLYLLQFLLRSPTPPSLWLYFWQQCTQDMTWKMKEKRPHTHTFLLKCICVCVYVCSLFTGFIKQDRTFQHHQYGHHHNDASETGTRTHRRACVCVCVGCGPSAHN